ncbi:hypothetical protein [Inquilinus limosus]|uniref:hypothetical protein n=1 Tax=Inquilinus limosus TaxID=171674 RepID=UPI001378315D|nr:hypothetical protein [Inquilinus limosus]
MFVASPGDVDAERKAVNRAVEKVNRLVGEHLEIQIDVWGWEKAGPGYTRPQSKINERLNQSDLFLGILWQRWGSPPGGSDGYTSGFEEEFELFKARREKDENLDLWLYIKDPTKSGIKDLPQLQKVLDFKRKVEGSQIIFYNRFSKTAEFEAALEAHLAELLFARKKAPIDGAQGQSQLLLPSAAPDREAEASSSAATIGDGLTYGPSMEARALLLRVGDLIDRGVLDRSDAEQVQPSDASRFMLLGETVFSHSFHSIVLQINKMHWIYGNRESFIPSSAEWRMLVRSGVADEVAPVWYWLQRLNQEECFKYFFGIATTDTEEVRAGAVWRLRRYRASLDPEQIQLLLKFAATTRSVRLQRETILYVADHGSDEHLPMLETMNLFNNYEIASAINRAKTLVLLRSGSQKFAEAVLDFSFTPVLENVPGVHLSITAESAASLLKHRSAEVRYEAAFILDYHGKMSDEIANQLTNDPDLDVRSLGYLFLIERGMRFPVDHLEKALKVQTTSLITPSRKMTFGDVVRSMFLKMPFSEVEAEIDFITDVGAIAYGVLAERHDVDYFSVMLKDLDSDFERLKDRALADLASVQSTSARDFHHKLKEGVYDNFLKNRFRLVAVSAIALRGDQSHVRYLRAFVKSDDRELACAAGVAIGPLGDESDIPALIAAASSTWSQSDIDKLAAVIVRLSKKPALIIAAESISVKLRAAIAKIIHPWSYKDVRDHWIDLLRSSDSDLRVSVARNIARIIPKSEVVTILNRYLSEGYYWFDVTSILDELIYSSAKHLPLPNGGLNERSR